MSSTVIFAFITAFISAALGSSVVWYKRPSIAHWAFAGGMFTLAIEAVFFGLALDATQPDEILKWQQFRLTATSFLPGIWLLFSLTYARGDSRESLRRSGILLAFLILVPVAIPFLFRETTLFYVAPGQFSSAPAIGLGGPGVAFRFFFLVGLVLILMNLERTYRASVGTMRWRIKFMILGLGVLFVIRAYSSSQALLFRAESQSMQTIITATLLISCLLISRSLFRSGHFEVNVYPSQAVLHKSFTILLAGVYLLVVGVLAKLVTFWGGESSFAAKAFLVLVCLVLLSMLLLSDRVRLWIQRFVSRNFQRPIHDYRAVWRTFSDRTARCVQPGDLCDTIVKLVAEVFHALSVTVWLVDEKKANLKLGASTLLLDGAADSVKIASSEVKPILTALEGQPYPFDIDASKEPWAASLRRLHPDEFRKGGNRVCVPMIAGDELLGLLMMGDRVGGARFLLQDFELLKSVSDQAAANLLGLQLSQKQAQSKQLEAFQAMSTFFVHDLKNTASMLSLMLQNLPVHFNDPEFRADALRGVSRTVAHINDLISRLGSLRQGLTIKAVETDLNLLVTKIIDSLPESPGVEMSRELRPLPGMPLDPGQISNVVTNLVLNARDAIGRGGKVKIETSQNNGWAILAVTDNGCGMSPAFLQDSLFRPFQSTKKKGIGIGMFQSKMIVEAHSGRIEVETELGKGTTFRVWLPLNLK